MAELVGNLLVAQSGGPTAVINASVAGVIQEAGKHECIEEIYGGLNGILGILNEELIDINEEKARTIEGLKYTPAAALGTCRYKIDFKKKPEAAARDMDRLFEVFQAHNIRYFLYIGGNDLFCRLRLLRLFRVFVDGGEGAGDGLHGCSHIAPSALTSSCQCG